MAQPFSSLPTPDFRTLFESAPGLYLVLTPGLTIDLSYRFTDIGDAKSGIRTDYLGQQTAGPLEIEDITSNDVMLGVRWALGAQPAPMPVAFK